jgi:tRNA G18 (ribose-2'-O)-methylase SpoU
MRTVISDPDDPRVADYVHLADPARRVGFFIVEGWEAVVRLLRTDWPIRSVLVSADKVDRLGAPAGVSLLVATQEVVEATVGFQLHRGVVAAVGSRPLAEISDVASSSQTLVLLEGLNDHENLGAIIRTVAALGIDGVVLDPTCADPFYRRCVRVSMGAVLTVPIARSSRWPADLDLLKEMGFKLVAMTPASDARDIREVEPPAKGAVMLGSEASGLSAEAMAAADERVRIPQAAGMDSLNVGHAAAIALHHFAHR